MMTFKVYFNLITLGLSLVLFKSACIHSQSIVDPHEQNGPKKTLVDLAPSVHDTLTIKSHFDQISSAALSADRAVTSGGDFSIHVWDLLTKSLITNLPIPGQLVTAMELSNDSSSLVLGTTNGSVEIHDLKNHSAPRQLGQLQRGISAIAMENQSHLVAAADFNGTLLLSTTKKPIVSVMLTFGARINDIKFSSDGLYIGIASDNGTVTVWRAQDLFSSKNGGILKPVLKETSHGQWVTSLDFSPNSSIVATFSSDHFLRAWNLGKGNLIGRHYASKSEKAKIKFISDIEVLVVPSSQREESADGLNVINLFSGLITPISNAHLAPIVAFLALDDKTVLTASLDESVKKWSLKYP